MQITLHKQKQTHKQIKLQKYISREMSNCEIEGIFYFVCFSLLYFSFLYFTLLFFAWHSYIMHVHFRHRVFMNRNSWSDFFIKIYFSSRFKTYTQTLTQFLFVFVLFAFLCFAFLFFALLGIILHAACNALAYRLQCN